MPIIHGREEFLFQAPWPARRAHSLRLKSTEPVRAICTECSGVVFIDPREHHTLPMLSEGHTNWEKAGTT